MKYIFLDITICNIDFFHLSNNSYMSHIEDLVSLHDYFVYLSRN